MTTSSDEFLAVAYSDGEEIDRLSESDESNMTEFIWAHLYGQPYTPDELADSMYIKKTNNE